MKMIFLILALIFVFLSCTSPPKPVNDYGFNDYALYDHMGDFHRFSNYNNKKAIVLFVQGNGCPMVRQEYPEYEKIVKKYENDGFQFFMINSNLQDYRTDIKAEAASYNWNIPILDDSAQLIAEELDITVTTEVFVLESTTREILYRGPINDRFGFESQRTQAINEYLKIVLDNITEEEKPSISKKFVKGCKVNRILSNKENPLTYTKDISPILRDNCVKCHNDNGIAPWSMSDYHTINGWTPMIKEVLLSKRMPPYKADPLIGALKERQHLSDSNASKIVRWINEGAAIGQGLDELAVFAPSNLDWALGTPDQIVTLPETVLPATGILDYYYQDVALKNKEGKWLSGIAVKYTNQKVVHHITFDLLEKGENPINQRKKQRWVDDLLAVILPGNPAIEYPKNTGVHIPKDATVGLQIHYTTTGKEEKNSISVGFYYSDMPPEKELYSLGPSKYNFKILPYEPNTQFKVTEKINKDISLYYATPHMHFRGKKMMIKVIYPDKRVDTILSVPDYNFNWQWLYKFEEPIKIPAGSILVADVTFDNSYQNPFNPDPSQEIKFGLQSTQEMMIAFLNYTVDNE